MPGSLQGCCRLSIVTRVFLEGFRLILSGRGLVFLRAPEIWHSPNNINLTLDLIGEANSSMLLRSFSEMCLFLCSLIPIPCLHILDSFLQIKWDWIIKLATESYIFFLKGSRSEETEKLLIYTYFPLKTFSCYRRKGIVIFSHLVFLLFSNFLSTIMSMIATH